MTVSEFALQLGSHARWVRTKGLIQGLGPLTYELVADLAPPGSDSLATLSFDVRSLSDRSWWGKAGDAEWEFALRTTVAYFLGFSGRDLTIRERSTAREIGQLRWHWTGRYANLLLTDGQSARLAKTGWLLWQDWVIQAADRSPLATVRGDAVSIHDAGAARSDLPLLLTAAWCGIVNGDARGA